MKIAVVGMPEGNFQGASPNAHFLIGDTPAPVQLKARWWEGAGVSFATHVIAFLLLVFVAARVSTEPKAFTPNPDLKFDLVWLQQPGPGGGGGGGGNKMPDPPRKAELPGKEKLTAPVTKPAEPKPIEKPKDTPPPVQELKIAAQPMQQGVQQLPGVLASMPSSIDTASLGNGTGTGAGGGNGTGIGTGSGSGLGPGSGGGFGGGEYQPGNGVSTPVLVHEVKPNYTGDAMRAKLQGIVEMEAVVMPDGSVGRVRITRSLDSTFGLDQEAVKAVRQWRFRPGVLRGQPVAVIVNVELTFTLR